MNIPKYKIGQEVWVPYVTGRKGCAPCTFCANGTVVGQNGHALPCPACRGTRYTLVRVLFSGPPTHGIIQHITLFRGRTDIGYTFRDYTFSGRSEWEVPENDCFPSAHDAERVGWQRAHERNNKDGVNEQMNIQGQEERIRALKHRL